MIDKLKIFFTQEISASAVKVTSSANYTMSRKLNQIEIKVSDIKAPADDNKTRIENLEGKKITQALSWKNSLGDLRS